MTKYLNMKTLAIFVLFGNLTAFAFGLSDKYYVPTLGNLITHVISAFFATMYLKARSDTDQKTELE